MVFHNLMFLERESYEKSPLLDRKKRLIKEMETIIMGEREGSFKES